ncbi:isoamylase early set domain-containing protein [Umezawaea beigongshangensis]|uniref:isoamylase early set domain-containing protein n=1 Tax=Umezawaea beigongshangensis TaxID=2780383 RepID=UPI0018F16A60|nr:isoamylase early set domain-containing protein [Umezawaea beigongshangensis]
MISTTALPFNKVRVTFSLDHGHPAGATSVVGCFNDWTPGKHTLRRRPNGRRSASVVLPRGRSVSFRYLTEGGVWTDEPALAVRDERGNGRLTV